MKPSPRNLVGGMFATALMLLSITAEAAAPPPVKAAAPPAIELGAPFRDSAILQRGMDVPVWGWSKPGTAVTVEFAGQKVSGVAGKDGKWMVRLKPLKESFEPAEMTIVEKGGKRVTLKNILVGEVWMASGQSNMQWIASKCDVGARGLQGRIKENVDAGKEKHPVIREVQINNRYASHQPLGKANAAWSDEQANFSAIAFAFAYDVWKEVQVPVGILNCSFSQTAIQAWIPKEGYASGTDEYTKGLYRKVLMSDPSSDEHKESWGEFYKSIDDVLAHNAGVLKNGGEPIEVSSKRPGNMSSNRDATWLYNARISPMLPYAIRGAIWNQGYANMGEGIPYYHNLHSLVRGWREVWGRPDLPVYFHQFYSPIKPGGPNHPTIGAATEMRLGTTMARDIEGAGMASQIDIAGSIHYSSKSIPGQRLARHALKNQYGRNDIVTEGPFFKSYEVKGDKVVLSLENAGGGLVVAETGRKDSFLSAPVVIENGDDKVTLFYIADKDRVWHPASMKIDGETIIVSARGVKKPMGVTYGTGGVGFQPNVYNKKGMLPLTPFMYYDNKMVLSSEWPEDTLRIAGVVVDPSSGGLLYEWRKMPILSTQFRDNAVLQEGVPITFFGSVMHDHGVMPEGKGEIHFSFNGIKKTIDVNDDASVVDVRDRGPWKEWRVTVPAMKAGTQPKTLNVRFTINGELAHERTATNIVVGDVWYVAAHTDGRGLPAAKSDGIIRYMKNHSKRSSKESPSRYSVAVSRTPLNRFAARWTDTASGIPGYLGAKIQAKTGNPVGIVFMQGKAGKEGGHAALNSWIPLEALENGKSTLPDYEDIAKKIPGTKYYNKAVAEYKKAWETYWGEYVPEMIRTSASPDDVTWGSYPIMARDIASKASQTYNVSTHSFTPMGLKGILFLSHPDLVAEANGEHYGEQMGTLGNSWKERFSPDGDPLFVYTTFGKDLAPSAGDVKGIKGSSLGVELKVTRKEDSKGRVSTTVDNLSDVLDAAVEKAYE